MPPPPKVLSPVRKLLFSAVALVLTLAVAELALRATAAVVRLSLRPANDKVPSGTWIVGIGGDSVTRYGTFTDVETEYPGELDRILKERGAQVEVVNIAEPSRSLEFIDDQVDRFLARYRDQRVAVLVLGGFNDCTKLREGPPPSWTSEPGKERPSSFFDIPDHWPAASRDFLRHLRTYRFASQLVLRASGRQHEPVVVPRTRHDPEELEHCRGAIDQGLETLTVLTIQRGTPLAVLTYPVPVQVLENAPDGEWLSSIVNDFITQSAQRLRLPVLDLVPCVQAEEKLLPDIFYTEDGLHMTPWGRTATARCLAEELPTWLGR